MSPLFRRIFGGALKVVAITTFCVLVVSLLPPVQRRLAKVYADSIDGVDLELEHVWISPWGIELDNLHLVVGSTSVHLNHADVNYAFWSSLTGLKLDIEAASLIDVDIKLRPASPPVDNAETEAPSFSGLRPFAHLRRWLTLEQLDANGTLTIAPATDLEVIGIWKFDSATRSAAETARANLDANISVLRLGETLVAGDIRAELNAKFDSSSQLTDISLNSRIDPTSAQPGVQVLATASIGEADEHFNVELMREVGAPFAQLDAVLRQSGELDCEWKLTLAPGLVATFARGRSIADISGSSTGRVQANPANRTVTIESSTELEGHGWESFDPRLAELGSLEFLLDLDAALTPESVDAQALHLHIVSAERGELLRLDTLQPLRYERDSWLIEPEVWGEAALRLQALQLPIHWFRDFGAGKLESGYFSGALEIVRSDTQRTDLVVREPLRLTGMQLAPMQDVIPPSFEVSIVPNATISDGALRAEIELLSVTAATGLRVDFRGMAKTSRSDWQSAEFDGQISAHVPALQRIIPQLDRLHGTTHLRFDFDTLLLTIDAVAVRADSVDGTEILAADLSSQKPLRVQLPEFSPEWDGLDAQSASLTLNRVPIDWLSPYIPELEFRGGEVSGQLTSSEHTGMGLVLDTEGPLLIENVLLVFRGRPARDTLTARVRPRLKLGTAATSIFLEDLQIETHKGNELRADVRLEAPAGQDRIDMALVLDADIAEVAAHYGLRIATLRWEQSGALDLVAKRFAIDELSIEIEDLTGEEVLRLENTQPFSITAEPFAVTPEGQPAEFIHAKISPLRLERLLPNILGLELEGTLPRAELHGRGESGGRLVFAAEEPLVFREVTVGWQGATLLDRVTAYVQYEIGYSAGGFEAREVELTAHDSAGRTLLHVGSEVVAPLNDVHFFTQARLAVEADLNPLSEQPAFAGLPRFDSGTIKASLEIIDGSKSSIALEASLRDAQTRAFGKLPDLAGTLDAVGVRGERVTLDVPLRMASEEFGVSDLRLHGTMNQEPNGIVDVDAVLTGSRLVVPDVDRFSRLLAPREEASTSPKSDRIAPLSAEQLSAIAKLRAERHELPAWTDKLLAKISVAIDRLVFPAFEAEDLRGQLDISHNRARLHDVRASLLGAELAAAGHVDFDASRSSPYAFDFVSTIDGIDLGKLFLALSPDAKPTAEGRFDFQSTLRGSGLNPIDLGLSTLGRIGLSGRDGVFRGLAPRAGAGSGAVAARAIGVLTFSRELRAIGRLIDRLGELQFEQADFVLERNTAERLEISSLYVRAPQLEVNGSGSLEIDPQRPLLTSPLELSTQVAASGDIEILLDGMDLLVEASDDAGYRDLIRVVRIGGTPLEPDTSELWELLEEGANNSRGVFGAGLRALNGRLEAGNE